MLNTLTPQASRTLIVNGAAGVLVWPTDMTIPFKATSGGYTAATRLLTCTVNPPSATPFTTYSFMSGDYAHITSSTSSVLPPGDYEIESRTSTTVIVLKPNSRLPTVDVAAVTGYVYPNVNSTMTGGGNIVTAAKACSLSFDMSGFTLEGLQFTTVEANATTLNIYKYDGTTLLYSMGFAASPVVGAVYPVPAASGVGFLGGFCAQFAATSGGAATANTVATLLWRPLTKSEIAGVYPLGN